MFRRFATEQAYRALAAVLESTEEDVPADGDSFEFGLERIPEGIEVFLG